MLAWEKRPDSEIKRLMLDFYSKFYDGMWYEVIQQCHHFEVGQRGRVLGTWKSPGMELTESRALVVWTELEGIDGMCAVEIDFDNVKVFHKI